MALNSLFCADVPLSNYSLTPASADENIFIVVPEWPRLCATDEKNANWV